MFSYSGLKSQYRKFTAKKSIDSLKILDIPQAPLIAAAIENTILQEADEQSHACFSDIENRRQNLLSDNDPITIVDYGAGSKKDKRSLEDAATGVERQKTIAMVAKASMDEKWGRLHHHMIRQLRPSLCLELGSCVGVSAAYQASALKLNGAGEIISLEGAPKVAELAESTLKSLNLQNGKIITGPFHQTLETAIASVETIDYFFNDGHHDGDAVRRYFDIVAPKLDNPAIIFLDDIRWSASMKSSWDDLCAAPHVCLAIDFGRTGMVLFDKNIDEKHHYKIKL